MQFLQLELALIVQLASIPLQMGLRSALPALQECILPLSVQQLTVRARTALQVKPHQRGLALAHHVLQASIKAILDKLHATLARRARRQVWSVRLKRVTVQHAWLASTLRSRARLVLARIALVASTKIMPAALPVFSAQPESISVLRAERAA